MPECQQCGKHTTNLINLKRHSRQEDEPIAVCYPCLKDIAKEAVKRTREGGVWKYE